MFARISTVGENCLVVNDPSNGARGIPNCVIWEKIPEGKLTEYRFNGSGYRNNVDLRPKVPRHLQNRDRGNLDRSRISGIAGTDNGCVAARGTLAAHRAQGRGLQ